MTADLLQSERTLMTPGRSSLAIALIASVTVALAAPSARAASQAQAGASQTGPSQTGASQAQVALSISACRKLSDDRSRLACYDAAAGAFDQAQAEGQVVVIDRAQANAVRRQAFGFNLPSMDFLPHGRKAETVDSISVDLREAHTDSEGKWVMTTADDAVWRQTDANTFGRDPHAGSKLVIRKGLLGSFFCKVDAQFAVRCVRDR